MAFFFKCSSSFQAGVAFDGKDLPAKEKDHGGRKRGGVRSDDSGVNCCAAQGVTTALTGQLAHITPLSSGQNLASCP
jgi:hypothetical protein